MNVFLKYLFKITFEFYNVQDTDSILKALRAWRDENMIEKKKRTYQLKVTHDYDIS